MNSVWIGWDPAEMMAWNVAERSLRRHVESLVSVQRLALLRLRSAKVYTRPTLQTATGLWDVLSKAPMSTEHALSRFFVPLLCQYQGWALFVDGDVLFRDDVTKLFAIADPRYAVQVVQHPPLLAEGTKKDGVVQQAYPRKNWSSVILWNCEHLAHAALTLDLLNSAPGRDLHRFCWLEDRLIGALDPAWNHLVNVSPAQTAVKLAHFTLGTPNLPGHDHDPFADEWLATAHRCGYRSHQKVTA